MKKARKTEMLFSVLVYVWGDGKAGEVWCQVFDTTMPNF